MNISRDNRKLLDALSTEVFGTSSRWQKLVNKGYYEVVTEKKTETVPGVDGAPDTTKEVDVPVLTASGGQQMVKKYHTPESISLVMSDMLEQKRLWLEGMRKAEAEKKAKEDADALNKQVQEASGGSAT